VYLDQWHGKYYQYSWININQYIFYCFLSCSPRCWGGGYFCFVLFVLHSSSAFSDFNWEFYESIFLPFLSYHLYFCKLLVVFTWVLSIHLQLIHTFFQILQIVTYLKSILSSVPYNIVVTQFTVSCSHRTHCHYNYFEQTLTCYMN
jgi:hypothetical protein